MLTKMPKVGDVLIANENALRENDELTVGKEYVIHKMSDDGDALFYDDDNYEEFIAEDIFDGFTLKSDVEKSEPIGFIEISEDCAQDGKFTHFGIKTDNAGYKAIKALAEQSQKQRKRAEIQSQIDALQAELNAL